MKVCTFLLAAWLAVLTVLVVRSAEPPRKPTLSIALDDTPASRMLRAELSRDWLHANPAVVLTRRQQTDLAVIGHSMHAIQAQLIAQFVIVYIDSNSAEDTVSLPDRLRLPAVRINRGRWESLDRRAFAFETRPLLTLDWYRTRYVALYDRNASLDALAEYACSDEGYSGAAQVETPPPWEVRNDEPTVRLIPNP
jgi:hypothetical protein